MTNFYTCECLTHLMPVYLDLSVAGFLRLTDCQTTKKSTAQ